MPRSFFPTPPSSIPLAQFVLGLGGLFLGTAEFAAMSLLPGMARSYGVSVPVAGGLVSAYALGVVVGSPLVVILTARLERRRVLMWLAMLILCGNALSAMADTFGVAVLARFVSGVPHGAYYGTAGLVAASLVEGSRRTQSIGRVMLGLAAANLIGVPLVTWMGEAWGWRSAFGLVAAGGLLLLILLPLTVPTLEADPCASPRREVSALASAQVWLLLATAAIGFGGMFAVYTYLMPTLSQVTLQTKAIAPWFLALWGLGMVVGNTAGSWLADRFPSGAILFFLLWNACWLGLFTPASRHAGMMAVVLFLIGTGFALVPALQSRLMDAAPQARGLASALNHSAFNTSNAIGAWVGGLSIELGFGWASTGVDGACLAMIGLLIFMWAAAMARGSRRWVSAP
ncbi:MFS transporter [Frateuria aurantia]